MLVNLENQSKNNKIEYGDVVITEKGSYLIVADYDKEDYYGIDLLKNKVAGSGYHCTIENLLEELGEVIEVIKADNLELRRKGINEK